MKKLHDILKILTVCCFVLMQAVCLHADETASLKAEVIYGAEDKDSSPEPVSGMELSIWQIARLQDGDYVVNEEYADLVTDFRDMSAEEMISLSGKLRERIKENGIDADQKAVTDKSGTAVFSDIDQEQFGIYLMDGTAAEGEAKTYTLQESFLFQVPSTEDTVWNYDVVVRPKISRTLIPTPTPTPTPPPKKPPVTPPDTSDPTNNGFWNMVLGCSLLVMAAALFLRTRTEEEASEQ